MTNNRNGKFAVMHIDLTGTKPSDRNAAAKRTSEETEAQARRANQIGWQPVRRTKSTWHNDELDFQRAKTSDAATPPSRTAVPTSTSTAAATTSTTAPTSEWLQTCIPAPRETKAEQARLLTLLRTLHPILVVDQLCKALAYFGGIPGAPPPTDGAFPSSAATNGPGSLLLSWLAEIFPPTGWDRQEATSTAAPPNGPVQLTKRRRISKDVSQQPGMSIESQALSPDLTASPALSHGFSSASPQLSASRSFEPHKATNNRPPNASMGASLGLHQQQQPQRFYAQQSQHPSPSVSAADQHSHGVMQTSVPPRPRSQMAGAYGAQRHVHLSPQMIYTQQPQPQPPMSNPIGSLGHHSTSLSRSMSGGHHHKEVRALPGQLLRGGAGQAHGFHSHQHQQATSQPNTLGSFHSINEQSYLNMDYGLTERDVQDAAAVTALGSPSQLETTLAQPKMRDHHMFQSIGRQ
ncbi:uncharacterized protein HRG_11429 [Hirsutella rhossiliensis]|uniref:Uncharacterized protein n=1 Tax=Hirsutella rhossiliensis TaxID=111463 RepID=A0A9P8MQB6_9HYPO|nr:uncharacterized protein HRG_11429 [Hirsutella rhossiliensis]KAH0957282.1 hypothetical protein HRG_11429 [Hirsutella rhossiliensis]